MPGISGFVNGNDQLDNPRETLRIFEQSHSLGGVNFIHKRFLSDHCIIVNTLTGLLKTTLDQPASDPSGNTVLFLEGEVYNVEELWGYLNGMRERSLCDILLALFMERGTDFVSLLNGEFNIIIFQKAERKLTILNDHFSTRPMYYMQQGSNLIFGSEKKSILAVAQGSRSVDQIGLLQVFVHHHSSGGRTFISGLKCLPAASRLEHRQGRLHLVSYSHMTLREPKRVSKSGALIEEWAEQLKLATGRRLKDKERVLVGLSGGLDSRAVACSIPRDFRPIAAITVGGPHDLDVIYGSQIARRLDIDHFHGDLTAVPLSDVLPKIVWRTECELSFIHCRTMAYHPAIKEYGDHLFNGAVGDVSSGSYMFPNMFLPRGRREFLEMMYQRHLVYSETSLYEVFNKEFLRKNFHGLKGAFLSTFDRLKGANRIQLFESWRLYEKQTRMALGTAAVDSYLFESIRPFVDRDYLDFVLTLPTHLRFGQTFYQAMIYHLGREIRDIPNANTNRTLRSTPLGNMLNKGMELGLKARKKVVKRISSSYGKKVGNGTASSLTQLTRQDPQLRHIIEEFVRSDFFDSSIFNGPRILGMLDRHYQGVSDSANLLSTLATFAVGLPYFVYNKPTHCPPEAEPLNGRRAS